MKLNKLALAFVALGVITNLTGCGPSAGVEGSNSQSTEQSTTVNNKTGVASKDSQSEDETSTVSLDLTEEESQTVSKVATFLKGGGATADLSGTALVAEAFREIELGNSRSENAKRIIQQCNVYTDPLTYNSIAKLRDDQDPELYSKIAEEVDILTANTLYAYQLLADGQKISVVTDLIKQQGEGFAELPAEIMYYPGHIAKCSKLYATVGEYAYKTVQSKFSDYVVGHNENQTWRFSKADTVAAIKAEIENLLDKEPNWEFDKDILFSNDLAVIKKHFLEAVERYKAGNEGYRTDAVTSVMQEVDKFINEAAGQNAQWNGNATDIHYGGVVYMIAAAPLVMQNGIPILTDTHLNGTAYKVTLQTNYSNSEAMDDIKRIAASDSQSFDYSTKISSLREKNRVAEAVIAEKEALSQQVKATAGVRVGF